ncbi:formylglycine-generating enzyme family protein [Bythopirellula goksoeyrii]|uniref:Formylglycine-generating sulfatase enzyme n=1 Tax=Bythopirellula goksoeyrii TaxID=1400387 RepID=A0A5B9QLT6_9BACT|nr:SUMF1/EgtB/PvdO family nonheme iron enzyme [Bythopirellula goksoeyrii]QEG35111.1 Formylglycine-generating sulfatase enzyme [Bythopirellula goksoeyrii]
MFRAAIISFLVPFTSCILSTRGEVAFDWVTVGNPGNQSDSTGFGDVTYTYRISKYEVTNTQYTNFLNSVDSNGENLLALYNPNMTTEGAGGILFDSNQPPGMKYVVKPNYGEYPVVFVSFLDSMRFVNWLENNQGSGDTETGVYTISDGLSEVRSQSASYFIPSENEWYKAAYHKNDGNTGNYWDYPTSTDTEPYSDDPTSLNSPDNSNVANFIKDDGIANGYNDFFAIPGPNNSTANHLSEVGAYSLAFSPYGTFDQGGNVREWTDTIYDSNQRVVRGGGWDEASFTLLASTRGSGEPSSENSGANGFRIASAIPEPSTIILVLICNSLNMLRVRQRRDWYHCNNHSK